MKIGLSATILESSMNCNKLCKVAGKTKRIYSQLQKKLPVTLSSVYDNIPDAIHVLPQHMKSLAK